MGARLISARALPGALASEILTALAQLAVTDDGCKMLVLGVSTILPAARIRISPTPRRSFLLPRASTEPLWPGSRASPLAQLSIRLARSRSSSLESDAEVASTASDGVQPASTVAPARRIKVPFVISYRQDWTCIMHRHMDELRDSCGASIADMLVTDRAGKQVWLYRDMPDPDRFPLIFNLASKTASDRGGMVKTQSAPAGYPTLVRSVGTYVQPHEPQTIRLAYGMATCHPHSQVSFPAVSSGVIISPDKHKESGVPCEIIPSDIDFRDLPAYWREAVGGTIHQDELKRRALLAEAELSQQELDEEEVAEDDDGIV